MAFGIVARPLLVIGDSMLGPMRSICELKRLILRPMPRIRHADSEHACSMPFEVSSA
jgi:hypothetical protein